MPKRLFWILLTIAAVLVAGAAVRISGNRHWPSVEGRILHSEIVTQKIPRLGLSNNQSFTNQYEIIVAYEYFVAGQRRVGQRIFPSAPSIFGREETALKVLARFPQGQTTEVYYDAADPSRASLIAASAFPISGYSALVLGLVGIITLLIIGARFLGRRRGA